MATQWICSSFWTNFKTLTTNTQDRDKKKKTELKMDWTKRMYREKIISIYTWPGYTIGYEWLQKMNG